jgi:putative ABC transport system permease protein
MLRTTIKSLFARKLRLLTTSVAVMLGVAFMAGTLVLTDTLDKTLDATVAGANAGSDVYVRGDLQFDDALMGEQRDRIDTGLLEAILGVDGVATAEGHIQSYAQVVDKEGEPMGDPDMGAPVMGGAWLSDEQLNPFELVVGRAPREGSDGDHEVVIDEATAETGGFVPGDSTTVITEAGPLDVDVVGIVSLDGGVSLAGAQITMFSPRAAEAYLTEPGKVDAIKVATADGIGQDELAARLAQVVPDGVDVITGDDLVAEEQAALADDMAFFNTFLLVFAVIALFVGSFIIYNSFSILVAQRTRETALLRAIGSSRRQVTGAVLVEAVAVGLIASAAGLALGIGVAYGLQQMLTGMGLDLPKGGIVLTPTAVVASLVAGLGVSVASAVFPARRAAKVPPVAAMRDVAVENVGGSRGRRRAVIGSVMTAAGAAVMSAGLFGDAGVAMVGLGAPIVFLGVAVLGPVLARPAARIIGAPFRRLAGVPGTIARQNALRNPKRTSTTAAALMVGVALVGLITVLAGSTKASVRQAVEDDFHGDLIIASQTGMGTGGLSTDLALRLDELPDVDVVSGYRVAASEVDGHSGLLVAASPDAAASIGDLRIVDGSVDGLGLGTIAVSEDRAEKQSWSVGDVLPVQFATGSQSLVIGAVYDDSAALGDYFIGLDTYDANVTDRFDFQVVATAVDGVSVSALRAAVTAVADDYPLAEVRDRDEYADAMGSKVDMLVNLMYALLALAVIIALLGIANTLALSIYERTRELGLLRAVGMTRRQLRTAVRLESVIMALFGTAMGLVIGTAFGWAIVRALRGEGLTTFVLPSTPLVVLTVVGALAGVAAALLPARRAARLDVLKAISSS